MSALPIPQLLLRIEFLHFFCALLATGFASFPRGPHSIAGRVCGLRISPDLTQLNWRSFQMRCVEVHKTIEILIGFKRAPTSSLNFVIPFGPF